jgi:L-cysteine desulfidase
MDLTAFLQLEWKRALGCTEPASIAYAAATVAQELNGEILAAHLVCDPRMYKNCYAVGIPHSGGMTGILAALAIGACLPHARSRLECFQDAQAEELARAKALLGAGKVTVEVAREETELLVEVSLSTDSHQGRCLIRGEHTRVVSVTVNGHETPLDLAPEERTPRSTASLRKELANTSFSDLIALAQGLTGSDATRLHQGVALNQAIAHHGLTLFPRRFFQMMGSDAVSRLSRLVCAGVYARMSGEDYTVMSLSGSGNKGITTAVPLSLWGEDNGHDQRRIDEALALALLVTSATTHNLGALSAVCGCSNAAGIGLAAGLVYLEGGDEAAISLAMNNMVGNVAGMICDGAKIGCAMKTMTSVDAAFRAAALALSGIGIPASDGIIGRDGKESLFNLGRIARQGMISADAEILAIMQEKLAGR